MSNSGAAVTAVPMADRIQHWPVGRLVPYANNARTHSPEQIAKVARSITEFGFTNPILVGGWGGVIAGHARLAAAISLGLETVPVIELKHLSEPQRRAYILADNRLALDAGWDEDLLAAELAALSDQSFQLEVIGFSDEELRDLLEPEVAGEDGFDTAPAAAAVTASGDLWILGRHRLLCGDATDSADVGRLLSAARPMLMVTDPPYGVDYDPTWRARAGINRNREKMGRVENDERVDWGDAWAMFPGDVAYVWHAGRHASAVQQSLEAHGLMIRSQIVWAKDRFALSRGNYHWQHEPCWYAVRDGRPGQWVGGRSQTTLWPINAREDDGHGHGTQKPIECMRRPILNSSRRGQAVYDPFVGSGTTIVAAEMSDRQCLALEILPAYVDVAVRRWQSLTGERAILDGDGHTFGSVAAERARPLE